MDFNYTHKEHLHRFACWTAARAAQRGWTGATTDVISEALRMSKLQSRLVELYERSPNVLTFDDWHAEQVVKIEEALITLKINPVTITYGRIAKIIAIYIKTVYVSADPTSPLAKVAHPPIDSILLRNVKAQQKSTTTAYPIGLGFHWTKFCKLRYMEAVSYLRDVNGEQPFWAIEAFWGSETQLQKAMSKK